MAVTAVKLYWLFGNLRRINNENHKLQYSPIGRNVRMYVGYTLQAPEHSEHINLHQQSTPTNFDLRIYVALGFFL